MLLKIERLLLETQYLSVIVVGFFLFLLVSLVITYKKRKDFIFSTPFDSIILILLYLSLFLGGPRGTQELIHQPVDKIRLVRIAVMISLISTIGVKQFVEKKITLFQFRGAIGLMTIYSVMAMLSAVYSPMPLLSLWKGFEVFTFVFIFSYFLAKITTLPQLEKFINLNWIILVSILVTVYIGAFATPERAFKQIPGALLPYQLMGVWPHVNPNTLAEISAILSLVILSRLLQVNFFSKKAIAYGGMLIITLLTLILSQSRTSLFAFGLGTIVLLIFYKRPLLLFYTFLLFALLILLPEVRNVLINYVLRGQKLEFFYSMSGRLYFWPLVWKIFKQSPLIGYGFYAGHRVGFYSIVMKRYGVGGLSTFDNTYLDVLFGIGLIGIIPFLSAIATIWKRFLFSLRDNKFPSEYQNRWETIKIEIFCVFLIIMARSFTGPSFHIFHISLPLLLVIAVSTEVMLDIIKRGSIKTQKFNESIISS